jgi:hypothetical protein
MAKCANEDTDKERQQTLSVLSAGARDPGAYVLDMDGISGARKIDPDMATRILDRHKLLVSTGRLSEPVSRSVLSHRDRFGRGG